MWNKCPLVADYKEGCILEFVPNHPDHTESALPHLLRTGQQMSRASDARLSPWTAIWVGAVAQLRGSQQPSLLPARVEGAPRSDPDDLAVMVSTSVMSRTENTALCGTKSFFSVVAVTL